jgi:hypothetical protein
MGPYQAIHERKSKMQLQFNAFVSNGQVYVSNGVYLDGKRIESYIPSFGEATEDVEVAVLPGGCFSFSEDGPTIESGDRVSVDVDVDFSRANSSLVSVSNPRNWMVVATSEERDEEYHQFFVDWAAGKLAGV